MQHVGLILEGGAMRGFYTAGVLDAFLDYDVHIPHCFAVSAGACNAASYLPRQRTRFYYATTRMMEDSRYISWSNLLKHGSFMDTDFMFDEVANHLVPIDYAGYQTHGGRLTVVVTNCKTGRAEYHKIRNLWEQRDLLRASSSLPLVSPIVNYQGKEFLDGGLTDGVPVRFARHQGFTKNIVVLTRPKGYRKKPTNLLPLLKWKYRQYPNLIQALTVRTVAYNHTMDYIEALEEKGELLVIRPATPLPISKFETDVERAAKTYNLGIRDATKRMAEIRAFLKEASQV